jgi:hypothetical protein
VRTNSNPSIYFRFYDNFMTVAFHKSWWDSWIRKQQQQQRNNRRNNPTIIMPILFYQT